MADMMLTATIDEMLENAVGTGSGLYTGRQIVTFKPGAHRAAVQSLSDVGSLRVASAADFDSHAVEFRELGDAEMLVFPEIDVAVMAGPAAAERRSLDLLRSPRRTAQSSRSSRRPFCSPRPMAGRNISADLPRQRTASTAISAPPELASPGRPHCRMRRRLRRR